jgi:hypothetical protein
VRVWATDGNDSEPYHRWWEVLVPVGVAKKSELRAERSEPCFCEFCVGMSY